MNKSIRILLREITPPVLFSIVMRLLRSRRNHATSQKDVLSLLSKHKKLNENAKANEIVIREGIALRMHPDSRWGFEHFCYLLPEVAKEMDCFISHMAGKERFLDIGAMHGMFSLVFSINSPTKKAVAVDASPTAFARLLYNIHVNTLNNVIPVECALSECPGMLRMHFEGEHAVGADTVADFFGQQILQALRRTGDELCESLSFYPDLVKIDVEGHEVKVVKGLSSIIENNRPTIFLELHPRRIAQEGDKIHEIARFLIANGYRASFVDGRELQVEQITQFKEDQRLLLIPT